MPADQSAPDSPMTRHARLPISAGLFADELTSPLSPHTFATLSRHHSLGTTVHSSLPGTHTVTASARDAGCRQCFRSCTRSNTARSAFIRLRSAIYRRVFLIFPDLPLKLGLRRARDVRAPTSSIQPDSHFDGRALDFSSRASLPSPSVSRCARWPPEELQPDQAAASKRHW